MRAPSQSLSGDVSSYYMFQWNFAKLASDSLWVPYISKSPITLAGVVVAVVGAATAYGVVYSINHKKAMVYVHAHFCLKELTSVSLLLIFQNR